MIMQWIVAPRASFFILVWNQVSNVIGSAHPLFVVSDGGFVTQRERDLVVTREEPVATEGGDGERLCEAVVVAHLAPIEVDGEAIAVDVTGTSREQGHEILAEADGQ